MKSNEVNVLVNDDKTWYSSHLYYPILQLQSAEASKPSQTYLTVRVASKGLLNIGIPYNKQASWWSPLLGWGAPFMPMCVSFLPL